MEHIGMWSAIIAAIFSGVAVYMAVRNDKGHIHSKIDKKRSQIKDLEQRKVKKYGLYPPYNQYTSEDIKIKKLTEEIRLLERRL